jgi:hypothetical protein
MSLPLPNVPILNPRRLTLGSCWLSKTNGHTCRVLSNVGPLLAPIEVAIREKFIPALFGISPFALTGELRHLLSLRVKKGGLAIRFPVEQAATCYKTSSRAVRRLCVRLHKKTMDAAKLASRNERDFDADHFLTQLGREKPGVKRRLERSCETGAWFILVPSDLNGSIVSAEEFPDNVRLRYNPKPLDMPDLCQCDGCEANMTVEHALHCKVGGLVHCRHNDVTREFGFLCSQAFSNGALLITNLIPTTVINAPWKTMLPQQPLNPPRNNTKQPMGRTQPQ